MKETILLLDAHKRYTLSIIRSIGKTKRFHLVVAGKDSLDLSRFSRFVKEFHRYEPPERGHQAFIESLQRIIDKVNPDYIFPCNDATLFSIYQSSLYEKMASKWIAPAREAYLTTLNKQEMNDIATSCGVKVIEEPTFFTDEFPLVVKPRQSRFLISNQMFYGFRKYASNQLELENALDEIKVFDTHPLIQKRIEGKGFGVFAAAKDGKIFASFAHERIREVPIDGGVSTFRRSIRVHPQLFAATSKIVRKLNWTGILMVEFKGESEEDCYFMEVNGRPWGSLDLAVVSGVDFPNMMVDLFINQLKFDELKDKYNHDYQVNQYSSWILGEMKYVFQLIKSDKPSSHKRQQLVKMFWKKPGNVTYDTFRARDPLPFFFEFIKVARTALVFSIKKYLGLGEEILRKKIRAKKRGGGTV